MPKSSHEHEIVSIQDDFHRPFAPRRQGLIRDTEHTERNILMENREVPILHELQGLQPGGFIRTEALLSVGQLPDRQKSPFSVPSVPLW